jgi:hypothetical protein
MKVPQSISFDLEVLQALQKKAYEEKSSVSKIVNDLAKESLSEKPNNKPQTKTKGQKP